VLSPRSLRHLAKAAAVVVGGLTAVYAPALPYGLTGTAPPAQPPAAAPATPVPPSSPPSASPSPPPMPQYGAATPTAPTTPTSSFVAYEEKGYSGKSVDIHGCGPHKVPLNGSYRWIHRGQSGEMHNAADGRDSVHTTLDSYRDAEQDTPFGWQLVNIVC
jgi:MiAMP1